MQFGFMKGKGTTDAIFVVRQMQEKFRAYGIKVTDRFTCSELREKLVLNTCYNYDGTVITVKMV